MGRKSATGGVTPKGDDRIQLDFTVGKKRYRPTIRATPTETNLRQARKRLEAIKRRIHAGTFSFADEFPEYRFIDDVAPPEKVPSFHEVAVLFLKSIRTEIEFATFDSYRKILGVSPKEMDPDAAETSGVGFWIPRIGDKPIPEVKYSDLTTALGEHPFGSRKTRNNVVSVVRLVFDFAVDDGVIPRSPAENLKTLKVQKGQPDPYTIEEAEALIAGICKDWGQDDADYFEFCFFAGPRPSELIALRWPDVDLRRGTARFDKARVMARDKARTKTAVARDTELCPRALAILRRRRTRTGLQGGQVFGHADGRPYHDLQTQWKRWRYTHKRLGVRYREPYQARHTSVTWNLMIGKNILWVAEQHGHSPAVMLKTYARWLKGATEEDVQEIRRAMGYGTNSALANRG